MDLKQVSQSAFTVCVACVAGVQQEKGRRYWARESLHAGYGRLDNLIITHGLPPLQAPPIPHKGERETRVTSD